MIVPKSSHEALTAASKSKVFLCVTSGGFTQQADFSLHAITNEVDLFLLLLDGGQRDAEPRARCFQNEQQDSDYANTGRYFSFSKIYIYIYIHTYMRERRAFLLFHTIGVVYEYKNLSEALLHLCHYVVSFEPTSKKMNSFVCNNKTHSLSSFK